MPKVSELVSFITRTFVVSFAFAGSCLNLFSFYTYSFCLLNLLISEGFIKERVTEAELDTMTGQRLRERERHFHQRSRRETQTRFSAKCASWRSTGNQGVKGVEGHLRSELETRNGSQGCGTSENTRELWKILEQEQTYSVSGFMKASVVAGWRQKGCNCENPDQRCQDPSQHRAESRFQGDSGGPIS